METREKLAIGGKKNMETRFDSVISLRKGSYVIIDNQPCVVKSIDISKTGKHGASKARVEAVGLLDGQKRIIVKPGHENIPIPIIEKRRGQILHCDEGIMDSETFETFDADLDEDVQSEAQDGKQVEYWKVMGKCVVKRIIN